MLDFTQSEGSLGNIALSNSAPHYKPPSCTAVALSRRETHTVSHVFVCVSVCMCTHIYKVCVWYCLRVMYYS